MSALMWILLMKLTISLGFQSSLLSIFLCHKNLLFLLSLLLVIGLLVSLSIVLSVPLFRMPHASHALLHADINVFWKVFLLVLRTKRSGISRGESQNYVVRFMRVALW